jgi:hypothetical protein
MKKRGRGKTQSVEDINRQKARLRAKLPSEPWVEAIVHHGATIPANWLACETRLCQGRLYPAYYVKDHVCYECFIARVRREVSSSWPSSTSIIREGE